MRFCPTAPGLGCTCDSRHLPLEGLLGPRDAGVICGQKWSHRAAIVAGSFLFFSEYWAANSHSVLWQRGGMRARRLDPYLTCKSLGQKSVRRAWTRRKDKEG